MRVAGCQLLAAREEMFHRKDGKIVVLSEAKNQPGATGPFEMATCLEAPVRSFTPLRFVQDDCKGRSWSAYVSFNMFHVPI